MASRAGDLKPGGRRPWQRYVFAVVVVAAAVAVRAGLLQGLGTQNILVTFYPAVLLAAVYGGVGPGLLGTGLCALTLLLWRQPLGNPLMLDSADWLGLAVFVSSSAVVSWVCEAMHRARARAVAARAEVRLAEERRQAKEQLRRQDAVVAGIARVFRKAMTCQTEEELGRTCLAAAEEVTQSKFGFVGELNPQTGCLAVIAISDPGWEACRIQERLAEGSRVPTEFAIHGIYGRVLVDGKGFFTNHPPSHADRIGTPAGHPPLASFLGVPLVHAGQVIGMVGLANRQGGYGSGELAAVEALAPAIVQALFRKRAEADLRESERRLSRSQQIAHLGSWDLDLFSNRLSWSDEVYRIFGLEPQAFGATYEAFLEAVHPEDRAAVDAAYSGSLREGRDTYEIEHRVVRKATGEIRIVHEKCEHLRDESGRIIRSAGMVHDITERKRAEEAVRRSEALVTQAVRVAGLGIFEHDHRSDVVEYSPLLREMMRFGQDEPVTVAAVVAHVIPEDRKGMAAAIEQAHDPRGDGLFTVEYRVARPDGRICWLNARSQTFFEGEGNARRPLRTIGVVLDVTERREFQAGLERLVAERTARLQEMVGELEHFSYTITHDMRAPLRAMQGFSEMMTEACAGCREQEENGFLRRIATSARRMDSLITDALSYSRAVRQELALTPVDAGALLRGMLDSYPELQPSKAQIEIEGQMPLVMGNEAGLTQCFSNLLGNAVKFTKPGTKPIIRVWAEHRSRQAEPFTLLSPQSTVSGHGRSASNSPIETQNSISKNGIVRIWVEDNGLGIPATMLPRVFDMFARGHNTYEGTGIGLALVRKVVERMEGRVGVESEDGKGSRFWVELRAVDG